MKVIVTTKFKDKYTMLWHEVDDEISVTKERYEEIKSFVKIKETPKKDDKKANL